MWLRLWVIKRMSGIRMVVPALVTHRGGWRHTRKG